LTGQQEVQRDGRDHRDPHTQMIDRQFGHLHGFIPCALLDHQHGD
jgi:hypothetical protein